MIVSVQKNVQIKRNVQILGGIKMNKGNKINNNITVYELITKLENGLTTNEDIIELVGNYPLVSYMILSKKGNEHLKDIMKVLPEVTCDIVESRLRRNFEPEAAEKQVEEPKPDKSIRPEKATEEEQVAESEEVKEVTEEGNKPAKKSRGTRKPKDISIGTSYENMTVYEAYKECKRRGIEGVKPKKKKNDYVEILIENDIENEKEEFWD